MVVWIQNYMCIFRKLLWKNNFKIFFFSNSLKTRRLCIITLSFIIKLLQAVGWVSYLFIIYSLVFIIVFILLLSYLYYYYYRIYLLLYIIYYLLQAVGRGSYWRVREPQATAGVAPEKQEEEARKWRNLPCAHVVQVCHIILSYINNII